MDRLRRWYPDGVWAIDFEYSTPPGHRPDITCMVAEEAFSGRSARIFQGDFPPHPPFPVGDGALFAAYSAHAEWQCFLHLGWRLPQHVLDLRMEHQNMINGKWDKEAIRLGRVKLLHTMAAFGLAGIGAEEKTAMRELAMQRDRPYTTQEKDALLAYCQEDVTAVIKLLPRMLPKIEHLGQALFRGRYSKALAHMEHNGIPLDVDSLRLLDDQWEHIKPRLVFEVDKSFGVYEGARLKQDRLETLVRQRGYVWPRTPTGRLCTDADSLKSLVKIYPELGPLRELISMLGKMKSVDLEIGPDNRNRTYLSPFASATGRNQPSNSKFIFGASTWRRCAIKPEPGTAIAYIDFSQQELAIAAARSKDPLMMEIYQATDFYLEFGKRAGLIPQDATTY